MKTNLSNVAGILFILGLILFISACDSGSKFTDQDEAFIRETTENAVKIFNETGDSKAYTELYYADNAVIMPPNSNPIKGRENIEKFVASFPKMTNEFSIEEISGNGDMAYVIGRYQLTFENPAIPSDIGKYTETWRKQADDSWKVAHDIFNSDLSLAGHDYEADKEAINKLHVEWTAAINSGDAARLASYYTDDGIEMPPGKARIGKEAVQTRMESVFKRLSGEITTSVEEVVVGETFAFLRNTFKGQWTPVDGSDIIPENSKGLWLLQRQPDSSWKIAREMWNTADEE